VNIIIKFNLINIFGIYFNNIYQNQELELDKDLSILLFVHINSIKAFYFGEVAERLKALVLKTSNGATRSWVRIPPSPPLHLKIFKYFRNWIVRNFLGGFVI
tara:strand:+ start:194 stop:499 length:306 start_codon:yes stop_codon:yes gene_type:complete